MSATHTKVNCNNRDDWTLEQLQVMLHYPDQGEGEYAADPAYGKSMSYRLLLGLTLICHPCLLTGCDLSKFGSPEAENRPLFEKCVLPQGYNGYISQFSSNSKGNSLDCVTVVFCANCLYHKNSSCDTSLQMTRFEGITPGH